MRIKYQVYRRGDAYITLSLIGVNRLTESLYVNRDDELFHRRAEYHVTRR